MEKKESTPLTIRIPVTVKAALEDIASRDDRSLNYVVNAALREYLRNHQKD